MKITHKKLAIIDALGPFFVKDFKSNSIINWSKVPFSSLEKKGRLPAKTREQIVHNFEIYVKDVSRLGYNSLSIDDVAHLANLDIYNDNLQQLLADYRALYKAIFAVAKKYHLSIFINTDYLFSNGDIKQYLSQKNLAPADFFIEALHKVFTEFSEIDGIILRVGENDGKDVDSAFLSTLQLHTPQQANTLLKKILPLFEQRNKTLIFRTWTVGVYKIGDLIWNERTFTTVFSGIKSDALIVSMKFGDTDFMRYLKLNPLFFKSSHKKIIELQTRREWEGMGMVPSFVGWEYEKYFTQLKSNSNLIGIHVWCQTGGWATARWNNLTYLENSSFWNELNTFVTIKIYMGNSAPKAIEAFCEVHAIKNVDRFNELLQLSDFAIKNGMYIPEFAKTSYYFRRSRVPTLLWLSWDQIQPLGFGVVRSLVSDPKKVMSQAQQAQKASEKMISLAQQLELPPSALDSVVFLHATLEVFTELKRYFFGFSIDLSTLQKQIDRYTNNYPKHYRIPHLAPTTSSPVVDRVIKLLIRSYSSYRHRDIVLLATSPIQRIIAKFYLRKKHSHLRGQSMGFDVLFK